MDGCCRDGNSTGQRNSCNNTEHLKLGVAKEPEMTWKINIAKHISKNVPDAKDPTGHCICLICMLSEKLGQHRE